MLVQCFFFLSNLLLPPWHEFRIIQGEKPYQLAIIDRLGVESFEISKSVRRDSSNTSDLGRPREIVWIIQRFVRKSSMACLIFLFLYANARLTRQAPRGFASRWVEDRFLLYCLCHRDWNIKTISSRFRISRRIIDVETETLDTN